MVLGDLHLNFGDYIQKNYGGDAIWSGIVSAAGYSDKGSKWVSSCPYSDAVFEGCATSDSHVAEGDPRIPDPQIFNEAQTIAQVDPGTVEQCHCRS